MCYFVAFITVCSMVFTACSSDDENEKSNKEEIVDDESYVVDELDVLQQNLVRTDSLGNFVRRVYGVSLDKSDSTIVSVGVDSFEEAQEDFQSLFSDTTAFSADGNRATFTTQNGYVDLTPEDGTNGLVGTVKFNLKGLKYVSQINFILNSAWPENAESKGYHKIGEVYEYKGWTGKNLHFDDFTNPAPIPTPDWDELHKFVCIREYNRGRPAMLVAITNTAYRLPWNRSDKFCENIPALGKVHVIRRDLNDRRYKDKIKSTYKTLGIDLDKDSIVWIADGFFIRHDNSPYEGTDERITYNLKKGNCSLQRTGFFMIYGYEEHYHEIYGEFPQYPVMFYLESMQTEE